MKECSMQMQLGILPTDTYPALVCDIEARKSVERMYTAKGMNPSKKLSILVRNFADIDAYTLGFPNWEQDTFKLARKALPGPVRPSRGTPAETPSPDIRSEPWSLVSSILISTTVIPPGFETPLMAHRCSCTPSGSLLVAFPQARWR
jgi:hypothetical protein